MKGKHKCLNRCRKGIELKIVSLQCGPAKRQQLCAMGLIPGCRVTLVKNNNSGSSIVRTGETSLILDNAACGSVICEEGHFFCPQC